MTQNSSKRQKQLMKKRQKDKLRIKSKAKSKPFALLSSKQKIRIAAKFPIHDCLINPSWQDMGLATITISRLQPNGKLTVGVFLVDILCLGLKNTIYGADTNTQEYETNLSTNIYHVEEPVECTANLAHNIIYGGIDYAKQFGFTPHKDFELTRHILDDRENIEPCDNIEFGRDGKPLYISGPHDNVQQIMRQLEGRVGADNFDYMAGMPTTLPTHECQCPECGGKLTLENVESFNVFDFSDLPHSDENWIVEIDELPVENEYGGYMATAMIIINETKGTLASFVLEDLDAISCWDILQNFIAGNTIEGESQHIDKPRLPKSIVFQDYDNEFFSFAAANLEPLGVRCLYADKKKS